ncbi:MAG TPA: choice-of-anchor Q domain-containing protein [Myxococcota bacterium]|nr:choice-of-anchor Q domain-containing protein [Myxococcota bacterium]
MRTFNRARFTVMVMFGLVTSSGLTAAVFFPTDASSLVSDLTTANTNCEDDIIYLGGIIYNLSSELTVLADNGISCNGESHTLEVQEGTLSATGNNRIFEVDDGATLSLDSVTLTDGNPEDVGGAILVDSGGTLASVTRSVFINNSGTAGGAIAVFGALGKVSYSTFCDNTATGCGDNNGGGAIALLPSYGTTDTPSIAQLSGPCSANEITSSTFSRNIAVNDGGAIAIFGAACAADVISDSTFSHNSAAVEGGAVALIGGGALVTLANSTIANNNATLKGGGIAIETDSTLGNLFSTIVACNGAHEGPDVFTNGVFELESFNLIGDNSGSDIVAGIPNDGFSFVGTNLDPIDPRLKPLEENGGPTETRALHHRSLAVDHGSNAVLQLFFDQRGPDFFRSIGERTDIGAYEKQGCHDSDDTDGDGIGDDCDKCPHDPSNDGDHDGICDDEDECPGDSENQCNDEEEEDEFFEDDGDFFGPPFPPPLLLPPPFDPYFAFGGGFGGGGFGGPVGPAAGGPIAPGGPAALAGQPAGPPAASDTFAKKPQANAARATSSTTSAEPEQMNTTEEAPITSIEANDYIDSETEYANTTSYEKRSPEVRDATVVPSSGCSSIGTKGQQASNFFLMLFLMLGGLKTSRRKTAQVSK